MPGTSTDSVVQWQFTIQAQGFQTRWGILGSFYYSQFMPGGVVNNAANPPRRVGYVAYQLARRQYLRDHHQPSS